jgi:hypothetical protein
MLLKLNSLESLLAPNERTATNRTAGRDSAGDAGMAPRGVDAIAEWEVLWLTCAREPRRTGLQGVTVQATLEWRRGAWMRLQSGRSSG